MSVEIRQINIGNIPCEPHWHFYMYYENNRSDVGEFFSGLQKSQKEKIIALLQRLASKGAIYNTEQFKKLHNADGLFELKIHGVRFCIKFIEPRCILLVGYLKKSDDSTNVIDRQIEKAKRRSQIIEAEIRKGKIG